MERINNKELNSHDLAREIEIVKLQEENERLNGVIQTYNILLKSNIKENEELKSQLRGTTHCFDEEEHNKLKEENQKLKKQLEEWEHRLKCSKEMLDIQGQKGNYDYDEYMLGLYNGMEYIIALFETREPNFISGKDVEFTNNKTQQKEFINYLESWKENEEYCYLASNPIDRCRKDIYKEVLQKYKEIIGVSDEKEN